MRTAVIKRRIQAIYHFTQLQNVDSIMQNGIIPRKTLDDMRHPYEFNDPYRRDNQKGASCFSIEHPNYKMFWPVRQENPGKTYVVFAVHPSILWEKDCAFCCENAASANVTSIPINQRKGVEAFEKLFHPLEDKPTRSELRLGDNFPTNPQAEVLVFDVVPPHYIQAIVCLEPVTKNQLQQKFPHIPVLCHKQAFYPRHDHKAW